MKCTEETSPTLESATEAHTLDQDLRDFYKKHNVEVSSLLKKNPETSTPGKAENNDPFLYRFVRLNPRFQSEETLANLKEELDGVDPISVNWLSGEDFYALPASFSLSSSPTFQAGRVYGMDVSSGAGVAALVTSIFDREDSNPSITKPGSVVQTRVLDLCCCPGLKLCALADHFQDVHSTVVGVDISEHRMALCKKIVQKYHIDAESSGKDYSKASSDIAAKIQLYCQDGTLFGTQSAKHNLVFDSRVAIEEEQTRGTRKRKNKSARARERKRLKEIQDSEMTSVLPKSLETSSMDHTGIQIEPFDYVLVDAECSTDGSLKHMKERLKDASSTKEESNHMLTNQTQLNNLVDLQRRLIASGFRLLKEDGTLVYSTCSLSEDQNEKIVKWLLDTAEDAYLIPLEFPLAKHSKLVVEGSLKGTIRFYPNIGGNMEDLFGDGFFLAKIAKRTHTKAP